MEGIKNIYSKYVTNSDFVYNSYQKDKIIIFQKLDPDCNNNLHMLYKADRLKMIMIFHKLDPTTRTHFDDIIVNNVSYYNTIEPAFFYDLCIDNYSGVYMKWDDNGNLICKGEYQNGIKKGLWTFWHDNGQKSEEGYFVNGRQTKIWMCWNRNGEKILKIII
jgi:hypothetical protein